MHEESAFTETLKERCMPENDICMSPVRSSYSLETHQTVIRDMCCSILARTSLADDRRVKTEPKPEILPLETRV